MFIKLTTALTINVNQIIKITQTSTDSSKYFLTLTEGHSYVINQNQYDLIASVR